MRGSTLTFKLLHLFVIGWLPGAIVFRLPVADRDRRASLSAEERGFWAVVISLVITLVIGLLLAILGRYSFRSLLLGDLVVTVLAAAVARFRLRLGPGARRPTPAVLVPLALVTLGLWRFFPPSEYIIGGKDPGTYLNEGIQIAQRGTIVLDDAVIASLPAFAHRMFIPNHQLIGTLTGAPWDADAYGTRFMGFLIRNRQEGEVIGQFPHLFPTSIAIGYGIDGLTGARQAVGVWAILGLVAVYFAGARIFGRAVAAAAAGLLVLHVIEVWFARYPNAEVAMQTLLFAAILANGRAHVDGDRFFAPVAAALLGLLLFLRFDAILGVAGALGGLALSAIDGRRPGWSFVLVLALTAVLAGAYLLGPMRAYADLPIIFLTHLRWWHYAILLMVIASACVAVVIGARSSRLTSFVLAAAPAALTALVVVAAVYALFFRHPGGKLTDYDAYALRTFTSFYVTLPALIAALAGYAIAARRAFWRAPAFFVTVTLFSCFVFYKIRIVPDHFWMARRFLPVILPGALLFTAAAALCGLRSRGTRARLMWGSLGFLFLAWLAGQYARASQPILDHVEYAGIIAKLERLASTIGDDDLVIVESREASDTHTLALPLGYIYARQVLVLTSRLPNKADFASFLDWARTRYRRVLFVGGGGTDLLSRKWAVAAIATEHFQVPEYEAPLNAYPRGIRRKEFDFSVYEFRPPSEVAAYAPFDLDVGILDDLHVLRFHAKEVTEGHTFRWSRDTSYVSVSSFPPDARELTLWMSNGGRPSSAPRAAVTAYLNNMRLGAVVVGPGFQPYSISIPKDVAQAVEQAGEPAQLKLTTTVWNPRKLLGTNDDRDVGVMVDRVAIR